MYHGVRRTAGFFLDFLDTLADELLSRFLDFGLKFFWTFFSNSSLPTSPSSTVLMSLQIKFKAKGKQGKNRSAGKNYMFFASHLTIKYTISGRAGVTKWNSFESFQLHSRLQCISTDLFLILSVYVLKGWELKRMLIGHKIELCVHSISLNFAAFTIHVPRNILH